MAEDVTIICGLNSSSVGQLAALLANRDDCLLLPELNLFLADSVGALMLLFKRSQDNIGDGLLRAVAQLQSGVETATSIADAKRWLWRRSDWHGADVLRDLQQSCAKRIITPDRMLGWRPNYLRELQRFPQHRMLHLTRHPVHQCRDLSGELAQLPFVAPEWRDFCENPSGVTDPQIAWYRFHHNLIRAYRDDARYSHLRLEDMQSNPIANLSRLMQNWHWPEQSVKLQAAASPFLRPGCEAAAMGMEKHAIMQPQLTLELRRDAELSAMADWRPDHVKIAPEVADLARQLGYNSVGKHPMRTIA